MKYTSLILALVLGACGGQVAENEHAAHEMSAEDHAAMGHDAAAEPAMDHAAMGHDAAAEPAMDHAAMGHDTHASEPGEVQVDPSVIQTIGVRSTTVRLEPLSHVVRTTGRLEMDESGAHTVTLKAGGWIESLYVDFSGAIVRKGQPLLELYSPVLVATQEELILAHQNLARLPEHAPDGARTDAERLIEAARRRLAFFDVSEEQVATIERTREPLRTIRYPVPASGEVMDKLVVEGQQIEAGQPVLRIFDTRQIWVMADVFEQDLPWVQVGTPATIEVPYVPGKTFSGRVDYLYYMVERESRTAMARITLPRSDLSLRPGMYAVVELQTAPGSATPVVPEESVVWTGDQSIVILDLGGGRFRLVPVQVGLQADGRVQVLDGLSGGERIVTSAQFLIDSEARLESAVGVMAGHQH